MQDFFGGKSLGIACEHPLKKVFKFVAHIRPDLALEVELAGLDALNHLAGVVAVEWGTTRNHQVQDDTAAPDITLLAVVFLEDLRSYEVSIRAIDGMHLVLHIDPL
jgi:hypothetical protein